MAEQHLETIVRLLEEIRDLLKSSESSTGADGVSRLIKSRNHVAKNWDVGLKEKNPKNDYERIAMVINHLGGKAGGGDIIGFIRENPDGFANLTEETLKGVVRNAAINKHYGYIEFTDKKEKKYYRLTIKGKHLINALPNRPKVKKTSKKLSTKSLQQQRAETHDPRQY